jgi:hypothetical protein
VAIVSEIEAMATARVVRWRRVTDETPRRHRRISHEFAEKPATIAANIVVSYGLL